MRRVSTSSTSSQQRLPVNQRRHRVPPENRKRVATACNSCNVRRIKCSGEHPCVQCRNTSRECNYPVAIEKISIPRTELDDLKARCARLEACLEQAVPEESRRQNLMARVVSGSLSASSSSSSSSSSRTLEPNEATEEETEGRLLQDPDGAVRYLGSTSGATFLDLIKEFMIAIFPLAWPGSQHRSEMTFVGSLGRYQTWDSRPLIMQDVDPFWHPSKTEMAMMIVQLRYYIQDGSGDFASGGIYYWNDLDMSFFDAKTSGITTDPHSLRRLALFHAALAMACQLELPSENTVIEGTQRSEAFFARARWLIGNPLDTTLSNIFDIPVLSMMSVYLVEMNRRDAAYIYVSLGMHIAIMNGVHRGWVHNEQCKRSFWTLYILDRWLSVLNGRPPAILDEAIKLPLPVDIPGLPRAAGLRAHVELARVSGYIVCNTYRISPWEHYMTSTPARIENALDLLSSWASKLPPDLRMDSDQLSNDRACCELHMKYNQLLILTVRPIFFVAVKKAVAERFINRTYKLDDHPQISHIRMCSKAARRNLRLGRWIRDISQSRKLLLQTLHHMFNAAVILLLNQLLVDVLHDTDALDIMFAIECYDAEAQGENNYPKDCARVLRDMTALIQRLRNRDSDDPSWSGMPVSAPQAPAPAAYHVGFILNPSEPQMSAVQPSVMSDELLSQLASWMHYDESQIYNNFSM
ncbi:hypothetical protein AB5N19_05694 [Seiridium cardinale]|uniref:Zn(2)-C6 fungal-type domain-containing protein n=1 Tax=Seiridium cardinale TaxID=138064 RepID=A0ABR2XJI4_9PEZI